MFWSIPLERLLFLVSCDRFLYCTMHSRHFLNFSYPQLLFIFGHSTQSSPELLFIFTQHFFIITQSQHRLYLWFNLPLHQPHEEPILSVFMLVPPSSLSLSSRHCLKHLFLSVFLGLWSSCNCLQTHFELLTIAFHILVRHLLLIKL